MQVILIMCAFLRLPYCTQVESVSFAAPNVTAALEATQTPPFTLGLATAALQVIIPPTVLESTKQKDRQK